MVLNQEQFFTSRGHLTISGGIFGFHSQGGLPVIKWVEDKDAF